MEDKGIIRSNSRWRSRLAGWLREMADHVSPTGSAAAGTQPVALPPLSDDATLLTEEGGPPAHWVALVKDRAPHLLQPQRVLRAPTRVTRSQPGPERPVETEPRSKALRAEGALQETTGAELRRESPDQSMMVPLPGNLSPSKTPPAPHAERQAATTGANPPSSRAVADDAIAPPPLGFAPCAYEPQQPDAKERAASRGTESDVTKSHPAGPSRVIPEPGFIRFLPSPPPVPSAPALPQRLQRSANPLPTEFPDASSVGHREPSLLFRPEPASAARQPADVSQSALPLQRRPSPPRWPLPPESRDRTRHEETFFTAPLATHLQGPLFPPPVETAVSHLSRWPDLPHDPLALEFPVTMTTGRSAASRHRPPPPDPPDDPAARLAMPPGRKRELLLEQHDSPWNEPPF